jgi:hypothetical protein
MIAFAEPQKGTILSHFLWFNSYISFNPGTKEGGFACSSQLSNISISF